MGTKVQYKNYLPGYYSMRDPNEEAGNGWSHYYEDTVPRGQFYNGFTPRSTNGYSEYDIEVLKETMLKHEAIFRKQVHELHRLYRIQRDLMDELRRKDQRGYSLQVQTSELCSFSSYMPSKDTSKTLHAPFLKEMNGSCSRPLVSGFYGTQAPLNLSNSSGTQANSIPSDSGGDSLTKCQLLDSKIRKCPRFMIDLQLPADAYIDNEDTGKTDNENLARSLFGNTKPSNAESDLEHRNDVNLTLGTSGNSTCIESQKPDLRSQYDPRAHSIADLNEPIKEATYNEVAVRSSSTFPVMKLFHEETQGHQFPRKSNSSFLNLQKNLLRDRQRDEGTCSLFLDVDKEENRREWKFFADEGSFCHKKVPASSEHEKSHELPSLLSYQNKTESRFGKESTCSYELSERNPQIASTSYSGLAVSPASGLSFIHCMASPSISSWKRQKSSIIHMPIAVQALPCVDASVNVQSRTSSSSIQTSDNSLGKWKQNGDLNSHWRLGSEASLHPNGFLYNFRSESNDPSNLHSQPISFEKQSLNNGHCSAYERLEDHGCQGSLKGLHGTDVKSAKDMHLNPALANGFRNGFSPQKCKVFGESENKNGASQGGLPWLRSSSVHNGSGIKLENGSAQLDRVSTQGYSQIISTNGVSSQGKGKERGKSSLLDILVARDQKNKVSDIPSGKKILGVPIFDETQQFSISATSASHQKHSANDDAKRSVKDGLSYIYSPCKSKFFDLEKQTDKKPIMDDSFDNGVNGFRSQINLNSPPTTIDQPMLADLQVLSPQPVSGVAQKFVSEIDMEASLIIDFDNKMNPGKGTLHNQLFASVETPKIRAEDQLEAEKLHEASIRMTAEIIVSMSSDRLRHSDSVTCLPSDMPPADSLQWFAHVIASNTGDPESALGGDNDSLDLDDGMDFFESMTLKLTETKVDEYCIKTHERESKNDEETNLTSLLLTKPRRGQARKRRQRRDFQKDILPSLASLSRHEVTEDMQTIGGLMRASGQSWQAGGARRNGCRSGGSCPARGRRRPRNTAATAVEIPVDPPPGQPISTELEIDGGSIMGWGRTRRCRRPRCPSGNVAAPLI